MGWDLYAEPQERAEECRSQFRKASAKVVELAGSVDGGLDAGYLNVTLCGYALNDVTSLHAWSDWTATQVQQAHDEFEVSTPPPDNDEDAWAYWSARLFIEVCARNGLHTHASY